MTRDGSKAGAAFRIVIPARYGSTQLPGKALIVIAGKPMIQWVYERAHRSGASAVLIAADDQRIVAAASAFGGSVVMTADTHASGTDRIAEVASAQRWADSDIVVNVQGDEPLMPPALINQVATILHDHEGADIATLASPITALAQLMDPNVVKVVTDVAGRALYFSRAPIPWNRDSAPSGLDSQTRFDGARRHVGIYAYRVAALLRLASLPPTSLENTEKLEQLRALENGFEIRVADAVELPGADVNTAEDLQRVTQILASKA
ncbi:MAG: 3-deoxy-manno-octulosonate cytidylyltransferase [Gammaproteobacteria bacterium]